MRKVLTHRWKSGAFMLVRPVTLALARTCQVQRRRMPASFTMGITSGDTVHGLIGDKARGWWSIGEVAFTAASRRGRRGGTTASRHEGGLDVQVIPRPRCDERGTDVEVLANGALVLHAGAVTGRDLELQLLVHAPLASSSRGLPPRHAITSPRAVAELPRVPESPGTQSGAGLAHGRRCEDEELRPRRCSPRLVVHAAFNLVTLGGLGALLARRGPARKPMGSYLHHRPLKPLRSV